MSFRLFQPLHLVQIKLLAICIHRWPTIPLLWM